MKRKLQLLFFLFILGCFLLFIASFFWSKSRYELNEWWYDQINENSYVATKAELNAILSEFEIVPFKDLPQNYLVYSQSQVAKYLGMVKNGTYYKIPNQAIYRKIIGHNRIKDLISRDDLFAEAVQDQEGHFIWLLNKKVLYKFIDLQDALTAKEYDRDALTIISGHRTPKHNNRVGGASRSRHIVGEALDFRVGDVNKDGRYTAADKDIILELADKQIIKNQGGVGRYPNTRTVHIDVRGFRARWNTH